MSKFIFLLTIMLSFNVFAANDDLIDMRGKSVWERRQIMEQIRTEESSKVQPVSAQSSQFIDNLKKKGAAGLEDSRSQMMGDRAMTSWINKEAGLPDQDDTFKVLNSDLKAKGGTITTYRKVGQDEELLNGNMVKSTYIIVYKNKKTRTLEFMYVKPTITGGHQLMEVKTLD